MKKKLLLFLGIILLSVSSVPVCAEPTDTYAERLTDDAELLDDAVEEELLEKLDELAEDYNLDPVVVLVEDYETYVPENSLMEESVSHLTPELFARTYYQSGGYGSDEDNSGIILLISMKEREWHIYIQGEARVAVNDYGFEYISERLVDRLGDDEYQDAIIRYADDLELFFEAYGEGKPYGTDYTVKTPLMYIQYFGIAMAVSAILAFTIVSLMKSRMNTAKPQPYAREYVKKGSFVLTNQQDLYLYSNTTKTAKPKESSGGSSGGRSGSTGGSGGGGKF